MPKTRTLSEGNIYFYSYYLLMLLVLVSWKSDTTAPAMTLRLLYLVALLVPALIKPKWLPPVLVCFMSITSYGYAYSYLPTMLYLYAGIMVVALIAGSMKIKQHLKVPPILVFTCVYVSIINLLSGSGIENITYCTFIIIVFLILTDKRINNEFNILCLAFSVASLALSLFFATTFENYAVSYAGGGDMERGGWTDPNYFGMVVGMGTVTSLIQFSRGKEIPLVLKLYYGAVIFVSSVVLIVNASRGAILAVGVAFLVILFASKTKVIYKVLATAFIVAFGVYLYNLGYFDLLIYRSMDETASTGGGRTTIWLYKLNKFFTEGNIMNWLLGFGYDGGLKVGNKLMGFHNDYVAFLVEFGFVGLFVFLYMLLSPLKHIRRLPRYYRTALLSTVIYLALTGVSLEPLTFGAFPYWTFYFMILVLGFEAKQT